MSEKRADTNDPTVLEVILVTGVPRALATRMTTELLDSVPHASLILLVESGDEARARELADTFPDRVEVAVGDVSAMDLGLSGAEYRDLTERITTIHHMAKSPIEADRADAERINVQGARVILQLAAECKRLRRYCHWSSSSIAGKRKGVILEEDLDHHQSFHNPAEETLFRAERLVRQAMGNLPITVFRPSIVVGDSKSGAIDCMDGPYYLFTPLATGKHNFPLPVPAANAPLNLVPIDFVVKAAVVLAQDTRAAGNTYHLTDPNPLPARRVFELVAEESHTRIARHPLPTGIAKTLLRAPGLERLSRAPRAFIDGVDQHTCFNCRHALKLLNEHHVHCPPFDSYVHELVQYIQSQQRPTAIAADDPPTSDPFE